jgi:hypothetical protein
MFFFEKKNQKTFIRCPQARTQTAATGATRNGAKVFCFFFSKRSLLPYAATL